MLLNALRFLEYCVQIESVDCNRTFYEIENLGVTIKKKFTYIILYSINL